MPPPPLTYRVRLTSAIAEMAPDDFIDLVRTAMEAPGKHLSNKDGATVSVAHIEHNDESIPLVMKRLRPKNAFRAYWMALTTTHAKRAFGAAERLFRNQHLCPEPFGYIERLHRGKVVESIYISRYLSHMDNFRDALIRLYRRQIDIGETLPLLQTVAQAMRRFHDAGLVHNDMGNQNILLRQNESQQWESVRFVDLDHTRVHRRISLRSRAYDLSRINLPDGLLAIFKQFYFFGRVPIRFDRWEKFYRRRFEWHRRTRILRHPIRTVERRRRADRTIQIPHYRNIWLFDPRSVQSVDIFSARVPKPPPMLRYRLGQAPSAFSMIPAASLSYKRLRTALYRKIIDLNGRLGVSMELDSRRAERQLSELEQLPPIPVHVSLFRHHSEETLDCHLSLIRKICRRQPVVATLVQDRRSVREPRLWETFCRTTLPTLSPMVEGVQIGRAVNRGYWGIWSSSEYHRLLNIAVKSIGRPDAPPLMGPGVENGGLADLVSNLAAVPEHIAFAKLAQTVVLDDGNGVHAMGDLDRLLSKMVLFKAFAESVRTCAGKNMITQFGTQTPWTRYYPQFKELNGGVGAGFACDGSATAGKLISTVTEVLCSGMVDRVYLHLPLVQVSGESCDGPVFTQITPQVAKIMNHWLTHLNTARFVSRKVSRKGIHCMVLEKATGEKTALVHSPGGRLPLAVEFGYDSITDYQGNTIHSARTQAEIAQTPVYFHNTKPDKVI